MQNLFLHNTTRQWHPLEYKQNSKCLRNVINANQNITAENNIIPNYKRIQTVDVQLHGIVLYLWRFIRHQINQPYDMLSAIQLTRPCLYITDPYGLVNLFGDDQSEATTQSRSSGKSKVRQPKNSQKSVTAGFTISGNQAKAPVSYTKWNEVVSCNAIYLSQ